jgi:hypothetical protein
MALYYIEIPACYIVTYKHTYPVVSIAVWHKCSSNFHSVRAVL